MEYKERLRRLDAHLSEHPKDYQAVIARIKTYSDYVEHERRKAVNEKLKKVAYYRRLLNEEQAE